jgi:hypothetical protein
MEVNTVKIISYSLFGDAPIYCIGALRNAEMAKVFYPDWTTLFWVEKESVPTEIITGLLERGADIRPYSRLEWKNGMFVRFLIADDPTVERFIVRDCDSRPSAREVAAVNAWIDSGKDFHAMRDHPYHAVQMLGGMWGAKGGVITDIVQSIKSFPRSRHPYSRDKQYGADQEWLWQEVWPKLQQSGLVHDSCTRKQFGGIPFPQSDDPFERFVGEIIDEQEQPNAEHAAIRSHWLARNGDKH